MRRLARPLLNLIIVGGLLVAAWPMGQTVYGRWSQNQLAAQWKKEQTQPGQSRPHADTKTHSQTQRTAKIAKHPNAAASDSNSPVMAVSTSPKSSIKPWPLTKLSIPAIDLETFIVQGWDESALRGGPGHMPNSAQAGEGNCVVAGHRNIYGSPFYRLDELLPGSTITLSNRTGTYNYIVNSVFPTPDTNTLIVGRLPTGEAPRLTLLTCTVPHTNNRLVVQAVLSQ